ncbi:MAG: MBOAT family protein [Clostridiales bacterium]|nr:MBOAT family protein [Clostridiales bacterium]
MLFTSLSFLCFLALLFLVYYFVPLRFRWMLLLLCSAVFYAFAGLSGFLFLGATVLSTYAAGYRIGKVQEKQAGWLSADGKAASREERKAYKETCKKRMRLFLVPCLLFNFGILAVLKYLLIGSGLTGTELVLPMGISFYTFQTMGYLIDVYRGKAAAERNIFRLALFTSFFPLLVQGPISDYKYLTETLYTPEPFCAKNLLFGIERILWGYFKKLVIADRLLAAVRVLIGDPSVYTGAYALLGMALYAVQLYADFTGGIDITIGIAQVLGIRVQENFNRPYFSKSVTEYWRRWHISLGEWFKEYLFYPVSVSKPMLRLSKNARARLGDAVGKRIPVYLSTILVWLTTGIWHGRGWNFVVWGLGNCVIILISQELSPLYRKFHARFPSLKNTAPYKSFEILRTVFLLSSLRMLDCYRDVPLTFRMFGGIFTEGNYAELLGGGFLKLGLSGWDYAVVLAGGLLLFGVSMLQRTGSVRERLYRRSFPLQGAVIALLLVSILIFGAYGIGYDSSQFIYNQF